MAVTDIALQSQPGPESIRARAASADEAVPALSVVGLRKRFGDNEVLGGVDLNVQRGEHVTVIGPSGSGKTTLLRCINYLERPSSGHIYVEGRLIGEEELADGSFKPVGDRRLAQERTEIGMVFQRFNLFANLNAIDNVTLGLRRVRHLSRDEAVLKGNELLAKVGLAHKASAFPRQLSGGQQQRVAIARALAMQPKLLLFDEPTSALDPELIGEVLKVMRQLAEEGRTMILVTHELEFASDVSHRVVFMDEGQIIEEGIPSEIFRNPRHERTRAFCHKIMQR